MTSLHLPPALLALPITTVLLLGIGCERAAPAASAAVARDTLPNGAIRVRHGPLAAGSTASIRAELRIGVLDGNEHEIFGDVRGIEADEEGTIYVLDHQSSEVRAFGEDGRFLRTLTRKGDGPGELTAANGMVRGHDGRLWIQDHGKWQMIGLSLAGEELERLPMHVRSYGYVWNGAVDERGRFWKPTSHSDEARVFPPETGLNETRSRAYMKWVDPATQAMDSIFLGERTSRSYVAEIAGGYAYRGIPFSPLHIDIVDPAGGVWTTDSERYRIARLNEQGDTVLVLEADVAPLPVTGTDREQFAAGVVEGSPDQRRMAETLAALAPEQRPVLDQLTLDDEGRLWVRRVVAQAEMPLYDVFDREGDHLGSLRLEFRPAPHLPPRIRDGRLYALVPDALDVPTVIRAALPELGVGRTP